MNTILHDVRIMALVVALFALGACTGMPMKGYSGPVLPADQTALVQSGPYTDVVASDGVKVPTLSVSVLPGTHTIEMKPNEPPSDSDYVGPYFFYARNIGSVAFTAEAGHTYVAYVDIAPAPSTEDEVGTGYTWAGYVKDETTGKRVAWTDRLRLEVEPRAYPDEELSAESR